MHYPSHIDLGVYVGTIGLFFVFFLLFARFFPVLALNELKTILKSSGESYKNDTAPVHPYFAKNGHGGHDHHDNTHNH
jgi:molybdopterin-containing oxidoreductase family membrane subunit